MTDYVMLPNNAGFTLAQTMTAIRWMQREFPNREIFLDGDAQAIVGRDRA